MATITIDDRVIEFTGSHRVIDLAAGHGIEIPHFCYHPALSISGNCRMCLVESGTAQKDPATGEPLKDENGKPVINYNPKPQISCAMTAEDGMFIRTMSEKIIEARKAVLEFILANHPLDCPVCDQAGECVLQDYSFQYGFTRSRFSEQKRTYEKKYISDVITPEMNRCIHCDRCSRFTIEIAKDNCFTRTWRGNRLELATLPGKTITHNYQGNMVDICPVGALTLTDFRFKSRPWFLKYGVTLCSSCGKGCNVNISFKDSQVYRIKPVYNENVNGYWMCDRGRLRYKYLNTGRRGEHLINGKPATVEAAVDAAASLIKSASKIGVIGSAAASIESCTVAALLAEKIRTPHLDFRIDEAQVNNDTSLVDGELLLAKDPYPNSLGARSAKLLPGDGGMTALEMLASPDKLDLLILVMDDKIIEREELLSDIAGRCRLITTSPYESSLDSVADVSFASRAYTETGGSFTNIDGITQHYKPVMHHTGSAVDSSIIFHMIIERLG